MKVASETFTTELFAEILPLAQRCWAECTVSKGESCAYYGEREYNIEPNVAEYLRLQHQGTLATTTLRDDTGALVGYIIGFVYRCLHHQHIIGGIGDNMYVEPECREHAGALMDLFITELAQLKANIVGWPTIPGGYIHKLLKTRGFVRDDIVMEKRINVCA